MTVTVSVELRSVQFVLEIGLFKVVRAVEKHEFIAHLALLCLLFNDIFHLHKGNGVLTWIFKQAYQFIN